MRVRRALAFAGAGLVLGAAVWVAAREPASPATLQERVRQVASTLRCPVCQELSVADSPSGLAAQMRATIAGKLRAGEKPEEIRASFVRAYGDWILLSPPSKGLGVVAWVAPVAALLAGALGAGLVIRRWRAERGGPEPLGVAPEERRALEEALASVGGEDEDP
ncbi:MAG: cytochrome c-type biogenesis protein [Actinomycetota bacterium]